MRGAGPPVHDHTETASLVVVVIAAIVVIVLALVRS